MHVHVNTYLHTHTILQNEKQVVNTGELSLFRRYYKEGFVSTERGLQEKGVASFNSQ